MATYYSSSEGDTVSIYSRDSVNERHSMPSSFTGNMLFLNNQSSSSCPEFTGISQQNFTELLGHPTIISRDAATREPHMVAGERPYGAIKDLKNEMFVQMMDGSQTACELIANDPNDFGQLPFGVSNGQNSSNVPVVTSQGLSLSLNTQILVPSYPYWLVKPDMQTTTSYPDNIEGVSLRTKHMQADASHTIRNSRYSMAAQELLDEIVNVWKAIKQKAHKTLNSSARATDCKDDLNGSKSDGVSSDPQEGPSNSAIELSPSEKQDFQNKLAKLLTMLHEVDRKYKHYYHQMQIVAASFDVVAGAGAAKPYTAVALHTISRHFRCLKDAVNDQIGVIRKKLGEDDNSSGKDGRLTRLRHIDQQLRQQRAFQQYGMVQQNAWRPQRGLPENSVSILRAWLFEHFLNPYPKDSEKIMLSKQSGLTRSQIANWFINARVRLWKPMIEDMYKEEICDAELESNSSSGNAPRSRDKIASSDEKEDLISSTTQICNASQLDETKPNEMHIGAPSICFQSDEMNAEDSFMTLMLKAQRAHERDGVLFHDDAASHHSDESMPFLPYQLAELGRYGNGNVSLTLGLQNSDRDLPVPKDEQGFPEVRQER